MVCEHSYIVPTHDTREYYPITLHEDGEIELLCTKCRQHRMVCYKCSGIDEETYWRINEEDESPNLSLYDLVFCKFLGYQTVEGTTLAENPCTDPTIDTKRYPIKHYVGDYEWYWVEDEYPGTRSHTGPDGGDAHYWRCEECSKIFELTDK